MGADRSVSTDTFIPFMRNVMRCEHSLRELNLMWRLIEASAKMNCPDEAHSILPMMTATREGFARLEGDLVQSLVAESLSEVMAEIGTRARHVIDIVVRNLYERTADVGFLATDQDLCRFVAGLEDEASADAVRLRLREYREKYTVYEEIMLLDVHGNVLAQIDEESPVEGSRDPLIAHTLGHAGYVETFRATDLRPGKRHALIYSHRMLHPRTGEPAGVLCLSFAFDSEMQSLFHARRSDDLRSIALLLDAQQRVVASSDPHWIAEGTAVPVNPDGAPQLYVHSGRTYLVQTVCAAGYQGYPGPAGWRGQVMVPIELAFSSKATRAIDDLDPSIAQGLLAHAQTFCPPLYEIVTAADTIRRVVWNGQVMTAGQRGGAQRLKSVLEQIGETGARTNEVFTQSIRDLYDTVLSSGMRDGEFLTRLLVDLLDRNLYERANDCRWWALTPELRSLLADEALGCATAAAREGASRILTHINSLYTVYTRLVVYDRAGRIVAASHDALDNGDSVLGQSIEADTLAAVLALGSTQAYHVTPWRASALDNGRATYVYHAAIRAEGDEGLVVGGIGIVFNAATEFDAMLQGATADKPQTRSVFVDRTGRVLAGTLQGTAPGSLLELPADLLALPAGESLARTMVHDGHYCIVACSASHGYREFKVSDGYRDDVLALSFESLGDVQSGALDAVNRRGTTLLADAAPSDGREMATFFIDAALYALDAEAVLEALPASAIAPVSAGRLPYCLGTMARRQHGAVTGYVWVFDLGHLLRGQPSPITPNSQVVVMQQGGRRIGLLVSELHGVTTFAPDKVIPAPALHAPQGHLVQELIKANAGKLLVQCLHPEALMERLQQRAAAAALNAEELPKAA